MIQFNLLPDVKQDFIKAKRKRNTVILSAIAIGGASLTVLVVLYLTVAVFQKNNIKDLTTDIKTASADVTTKTPDLSKILTIQNQLDSLDSLHKAKPQATQFFAYINQITPTNVTIGSANIDFKAKTLTLSGSATDVATINQWVDTIKFATYTIGNPPPADAKYTLAFSSVVLSSFTPPSANPVTKASYSISLKFDPVLFSNDAADGKLNNDPTKAVVLSVPKQISTRSETEKPKIFEQVTLPGAQ